MGPARLMVDLGVHMRENGGENEDAFVTCDLVDRLESDDDRSGLVGSMSRGRYNRKDVHGGSCDRQILRRFIRCDFRNGDRGGDPVRRLSHARGRPHEGHPCQLQSGVLHPAPELDEVAETSDKRVNRLPSTNQNTSRSRVPLKRVSALERVVLNRARKSSQHTFPSPFSIC